MSNWQYENRTAFLYHAEKALTKEEFENYVQLYKEVLQIEKKD